MMGRRQAKRKHSSNEEKNSRPKNEPVSTFVPDQEGFVPNVIVDQILLCGGFEMAVHCLRVSRRVSHVAKSLMLRTMPEGLREILSESNATQGRLARALVLPEDEVRELPHESKSRYGGGNYHIFATKSTVKKLLRRNGGVRGLLNRLAKQRQRREARAAPKPDNGAPPAARLKDWIKATEASAAFPGITSDALHGRVATMPFVGRPGSKAKKPNSGFWRADCRTHQKLAIMDDAGVGAPLRALVGETIKARLERGLRDPRDRRSQALTWDERETVAGVVRLQAKEWQAAGLMSLTLPDGLHDKVSLLDAFVDLNRSRVSALPPLQLARPCDRFEGEYRTDVVAAARCRGLPICRLLTALESSCPAARRRAGLTWARVWVEHRDNKTARLRKLCSELARLLLPFLAPGDSERLAAAMPKAWNCRGRFAAYEDGRRGALRAAVLDHARVPRAEFDALLPQQKKAAEKLCDRAVAQRLGEPLRDARGGLDLAETLETLRSLVFDSSHMRRDRLRDGLGMYGCQLRSDSKFCAAYTHGTTDASLGEVVNTMYITRRLFADCHQKWSECSTLGEREMRSQAMKRPDLGWHAAAIAALDIVEEHWHDYLYNREMDDRDYGGYHSYY